MCKDLERRSSINTEGIIEVLQHPDKFKSRFEPDDYCAEYDCYKRSMRKLLEEQSSY